jgi:hypothetical protein
MKYAPDKNNPFPKHPGNGGGHNNGGGQGNGMGGFMPGQISGLANDLQMGYGGTDAAWKNYLKDVYSPVKMTGFNFSGGNGGGKGNPTQPGGNNQGGGPGGNTGGGFEPSRPRHAMMPMRPMQMQVPQMGLLNGAMQQQPQQQGLLGDIDPQILAYLTRR